MEQDATRHEIMVALPPTAAFRLFAEGFDRWWPREYCWGGDSCVEIGMEPRAGGACREIGPEGFRCDWGRVLEWDPPRRLVFTWQVNADRSPQPDAARGSEVAVVFAPLGARTRVLLTQSGFARHGEGWEAYRDGMGGAMGWPLLLARYAALAG